MYSKTCIDVGVKIPEILLPQKDIDLGKWSVVACDQYTSQEDYWECVENTVGSSFSTLRLILPEVYLEKSDVEKRIQNINKKMADYLDEKVILPQKPGFIYVERKTSCQKSRKGLMLAIDLERYDYNKGSKALVRATEGTVIERLPPRVKIRENALLELPHIMLLIDDPGKTVIEPLSKLKETLTKAYDFELMMEGGHVEGYLVQNEELTLNILKALQKLADPESFKEKYGENNPLLFAVGDGNHSLASAKAFWESLKPSLGSDAKENHPARYALVEVVNVHDEGLDFEPIHRVVFGITPDLFINEMICYFNEKGENAAFKSICCLDAIKKELSAPSKGIHRIPFITEKSCGIIEVQNPSHNIEIGTLQSFLDYYSSKNPECRIDYIHGEDVTEDLGQKEGNIGFFLPAMDKNDLFKTVIKDGALPRKTFSMGEACEKRFYLEARRIK